MKYKNAYYENSDLLEKDIEQIFEEYNKKMSVFILKIILHLKEKGEKIEVYSKEDLEILLHENNDFFVYSDTDSAEYLDYCLFQNKVPYEVFCFVGIEDFLETINIELLKKILDGTIKICFYNNFKEVGILNYTRTIPDKVEDILYN